MPPVSLYDKNTAESLGVKTMGLTFNVKKLKLVRETVFEMSIEMYVHFHKQCCFFKILTKRISL